MKKNITSNSNSFGNICKQNNNIYIYNVTVSRDSYGIITKDINNLNGLNNKTMIIKPNNKWIIDIIWIYVSNELKLINYTHNRYI